MNKFKIHKAHKMSESIENQVTEWALELIQNHFGVEGPEELSREQLDEVIEQWAEMLKYDKTLASGLYNCISIWENDREEHIV